MSNSRHSLRPHSLLRCPLFLFIFCFFLSFAARSDSRSIRTRQSARIHDARRNREHRVPSRSVALRRQARRSAATVTCFTCRAKLVEDYVRFERSGTRRSSVAFSPPFFSFSLFLSHSLAHYVSLALSPLSLTLSL